MNRVFYLLVTKVLLLGCLLPDGAWQAAACAQSGPAVYQQLLNPALDRSDVHRIREVAVDREDLHISLSDGVLALVRSVDGHVTGAAFEGSGEILLVPPNRAERTTLALFTGAAVLEQQFDSAYFRFFDDQLVEQLRAKFRPAEADEAADLIERWQQPLKLLARVDALPLLEAMENSSDPSSRFIHARLGGTELGVFNVFYNSAALEQISVTQERLNGNLAYLDAWLSFPMRSARLKMRPGDEGEPPLNISDYRMRVRVEPPSDISAEAEFTLTPRRPGLRMTVLELSRYLRVTEARVEGQPADFIQNEAPTGSDLSRRGNDLIGLVFPHVLEMGRPVQVTIKYSGPVMFSAGGELLYVGERGTWYPNAGAEYSRYDLTFEYPDEWTLVATGKPVSAVSSNGWRTSRFVTERPISRAGFNLGKFETASVSAAGVTIHAFATKIVEPSLDAPATRAGKHIEPAKEVQAIAERTAATVRFLSGELDPFPYSNLAVAQLPALLSQSWPGLIYLSSMAFLTPEERRAVGIHDAYTELLLSRLMLSHETAHQWWGDAVDWVSYRDEWIIEALANYCALIMLERDDPQSMKTALEHYKSELLKDTPNGIVDNAGPVTLGSRLTSSRFPQAYERVLYGRGTWLIHMLRSLLRETSKDHSDALFFAALKSLLAASPQDKISSYDLQKAFEKVLPDTLSYEGRKSLDWFFDGWVNDVSIPRFTLENVKLTPEGGGLKASGTIRESDVSKDQVTAIPLYAVDQNGKQQFLSVVFVDDPATEFTLTAPAGTQQILLDPAGTVLSR
jgi:hypothetical protein